MKNRALYFLVLFLFGFPFVCISQDASGHLSIDCGADKDYIYNDLRYVTDANFTDTGENHNTSTTPTPSTGYSTPQFANVRSFPVGQRNCYNLSVTPGNKYLIRATFVYGNYDSKNQTPEFDLYLGVEKWVTVTKTSVTEEIIHVPSSNYIYVCLVKTGPGIPFISSLELRQLNTLAYPLVNSGTLRTVERWYFAPNSSTNPIRYPDDPYDRIWWPFKTSPYWQELKTTLTVNNQNAYQPPEIVMQSAVTPATGVNLKIDWNNLNPNAEYTYFFHFSDFGKLGSIAIREVDIYVNGIPMAPRKSVKLQYLQTITLQVDPTRNGTSYNFTIEKSADSTYLPVLSAVEVYNISHFLQSQTDENDVLALVSIKATYGLNKSNWQGDPCLPRDFLWEGIDCITFDIQSAPPMIKYLDLSSSGLSGFITPYLSELKSLEFLDLSHNNLSGQIPDFLAELPSLKVLNLTGNNFSGSVPQKLADKANNGLLFRIKDTDKEKETKKIGWIRKSLIKILALSLVSLLLILAIALFIIYRKRIINRDGKLLRNWKREDVGMRSRNYTASSIDEEGIWGQKFRKFTMGEIEEMTKKFETQIGNGGFGQVFRGTMSNGIEVAVKRLSPKSKQGYNELKAEVKLFKHACHQNLTPIFGYCHEGQEMSIVYKYMPNGSLNHFLSTESEKILTWRQRLNIAFGATQGLLYLHEERRLIHRDIKPDNILLDENLEAKLADYGLAREILEDRTHVTTFTKGSRGYVDPEYHITQRLRQKSDVFSIGVVLLRLITGRPAVIRIGSEDIHIAHCLQKLRVKDELQEIVDPKLNGNFDRKSAKKALKLATDCAAFTSGPRPTMRKVVEELGKCLKLAEAYEESQKLQQNNNQNNIILDDHNAVQAKTQVNDLTKSVRHGSKSSCFSAP